MHVDPCEVLNDVLHWIWSWCLQLERLVESTKLEWAGGAGSKGRRVFSRTSYDEHALIVAGGNLARALKPAAELFPELPIDAQRLKAVRLLRNLYEHWDEQRDAFRIPDVTKRRSAKDFTELFPEGRPWSISYGAEEWTLCGVLPLDALTRDLKSLEAQIDTLKDRNGCV